MTILKWKRGTNSALESYAATAHEREIAVDTQTHRINVFDGDGAKVVLPLLTDIPATLASLENDISAWSVSALTKVSQLTNDSGFWSSSTLTKVSQLTNNSGYKTSYCTHCTYCTYCSQCSNCHNCTTVQCTTVNCTTVNCTYYSYCTNCKCECGDDN